MSTSNIKLKTTTIEAILKTISLSRLCIDLSSSMRNSHNTLAKSYSQHTKKKTETLFDSDPFFQKPAPETLLDFDSITTFDPGSVFTKQKQINRFRS